MADYLEAAELRGVGGWLRLFVIVLTVISPIRSVIQTASILRLAPEVEAQMGSEWMLYVGFTWLLVAVISAALYYFAYRLIWVQNRATVRIVIRGLWIVTVGGLALDFLVSGILWPEAFLQFESEYVVGVVQALVFPTIWSLYLIKSRRVANTYVDDESEAQQIFG